MNEPNDRHAIELAQRGFVHIPAFLGEDELELLRQGFEDAVRRDPENDYFRIMAGDILVKFMPRFNALARTVHNATGIEVDGIYGGGLYFANYAARPQPNPKAKGVSLDWHQDHDSYFMWQDHYNYLNLYIPIEKPEPAKSNLTLVPFDRLQERAPNVCQKMLRRGATRAFNGTPKDQPLRRVIDRFLGRRGWVITDDEFGGMLGRLDFDLTDIQETPHLKAGDLLLMRGDILHRTQDTDTRRVAVSFRMMNGKTAISRRKLARGGALAKHYVLHNNRGVYKALFRYFQRNRIQKVTIAELAEYFGNRGPIPPSSCSHWMIFALFYWEKLRACFVGSE